MSLKSFVIQKFNSFMRKRDLTLVTRYASRYAEMPHIMKQHFPAPADGPASLPDADLKALRKQYEATGIFRPAYTHEVTLRRNITNPGYVVEVQFTEPAGNGVGYLALATAPISAYNRNCYLMADIATAWGFMSTKDMQIFTRGFLSQERNTVYKQGFTEKRNKQRAIGLLSEYQFMPVDTEALASVGKMLSSFRKIDVAKRIGALGKRLAKSPSDPVARRLLAEGRENGVFD